MTAGLSFIHHEDILLHKFSVASSPACLCTGNITHSSRSAYMPSDQRDFQKVPHVFRRRQKQRSELGACMTPRTLQAVDPLVSSLCMSTRRPILVWSSSTNWYRYGLLRNVHGRSLLNDPWEQDFFIGIVIAACLDPTNVFTPPVAVPWIIGLT
jgi:hypothetical protein